MELNLKMILSSVVTLSIAVATSLVLTKCMLKDAELKITDNLNKNIIEKTKEVRADITLLEKKFEKYNKKIKKIKSKISDKDLFEAQSEEIKNTLSSINLKLQDLNQKVNLDKDSIDDGTNSADASATIKGNGDNDNGGTGKVNDKPKRFLGGLFG